jgi:hypothetical protein
MIQFIKKYAVNHHQGIFKILLAKHEDDIVYGSILYHIIDPLDSSHRAESDIEIVPGVDEEDVLANCIEWIQKNIPGEMEVKLLFE